MPRRFRFGLRLALPMDKFETNTRSGSRMPSLDGLRAVSICMVVIGHSSGTVTALSHSPSVVLGFLGLGRLGVSIFFVISGFLITTLLVCEHHTTQSINLKNFYIRRAFRIFPGFYAYWLVALALTLLGFTHLSHSDLISAAVYVWNYVPRHVCTWCLGHTWSLSVEEQFYLLWPLILKFSGPTRGKWTALVVVFSAPFIRVASYFLLPATRSQIENNATHTRRFINDWCLAGSCVSKSRSSHHSETPGSFKDDSGCIAGFCCNRRGADPVSQGCVCFLC